MMPLVLYPTPGNVLVQMVTAHLDAKKVFGF
jgi:hypothetical protein